MGIVSLILGYIGFWKYSAQPGAPWWDWGVLYRTAQLFVLQSGDVSGSPPWQLNIARFLVPIVPAWTVAKAVAALSRDRLKMLKLGRMSDHVIVCGLGRKGLQLVKEFQEHGDKVVAIEIDETNDLVRVCRAMGVIVLIGDTSDISLLRKARAHHAKHIIAISGDDGVNVNTAVQVSTLRRSSDGGGPVRCFVHVANLKLSRMLDCFGISATSDAGFESEVFNVYQNSARALFHMHQLDYERIDAGDPRAVRLIVVGFGKMGESVAVQAARIGHFANGRKLKITAVDKSAEEVHRLSSRYPQLGQICDLEFVQGDIEDPGVLDRVCDLAAHPDSLTSVAICLDGDSPSLFAGLSVFSRLRDTTTPIYVRMTDDSELAAILDAQVSQCEWGDRIRPFGMADLTCTRNMLVDEEQDALAMEIHKRYVELRAPDLPAGDPSLRPWEILDARFRDSSRAQADHIPIKLRAIGCYSSKAEGRGNPVEEFTDQEVDVLSRMEHARFCAERLIEGWAQGPRDVECRMSPYLATYEQLPDDIKKMNREMVRSIPGTLQTIGERIYRERVT